MNVRYCYVMKFISIFLFTLSLSFSFTNTQESTKPKSKAQIDYQEGIKVISNPNIPVFGEKSFNLIRKQIFNKKFLKVEIDLDENYNLFVLEQIQKKLFKFNKEGIYQQTIECNKFINPMKLFIDSENRIYVSDKNTLHLFNNNGTYLDNIEFPYYIQNFAITKKQKVIIHTSYYKLDNYIYEIALFDLEGNYIRTIFEQSTSDPNRSLLKFMSRYHPKLIFRHNKDIGVYGFSTDYKLYLINQNGEISLIIKKIEPANVITEKERNEVKSIEKSVLLPKYKPFFSDIFIDNEGNIYIEKWENRNRTFEFFDKEGNYLYKTKAPLIPIFKIYNKRMYCGKFIENSGFIKLIEYKF
jgi:hypothetical protein